MFLRSSVKSGQVTSSDPTIWLFMDVCGCLPHPTHSSTCPPWVAILRRFFNAGPSTVQSLFSRVFVCETKKSLPQLQDAAPKSTSEDTSTC